MEPYLIDRLHVQRNYLRISACRQFTRNFLLDDFFAEYEGIDLEEAPESILMMPFLLNVLPIIWITGQHYRIRSLDRDLALSLQKVRQAFQEMYPGTSWNGELIPDRLVETSHGPAGKVGALFSGGVDSVCTAFRQLEAGEREGKRSAAPHEVGGKRKAASGKREALGGDACRLPLTSQSTAERLPREVLITIWGANVALENTRGWQIVKRQCERFGRDYGQENGFIKSNFLRFLYTARLKTLSREITNWWTQVQHGMGLAGVTAPLLHAKGCGKLFIASSHTLEYKAAWGSDHRLDNHLRWTGASVIHDGPELTRQQKLQEIINISKHRSQRPPFLYVCTSSAQVDGKNCCGCEKCLRTILGLVLEGEKPGPYGFDVDIDLALAAIKERFETKAMPIDVSAGSFWCELQNRGREVLAGDACPPGFRTDFLGWLAALDVEAYRLEYSRRTEPGAVVVRGRRALKQILEYMPLVGRTLQKTVDNHRHRSLLRQQGTERAEAAQK